MKNYDLKLNHEEREHIFTCGTRGTVAHTVDIKINFLMDMQTHDDFYSELEHFLRKHIEGEIEGYLDNC